MTVGMLNNVQKAEETICFINLLRSERSPRPHSKGCTLIYTLTDGDTSIHRDFGSLIPNCKLTLASFYSEDLLRVELKK